MRVIDANGWVIPWKEVSRINQGEMKALMTGVVNRVFTYLARPLFSPTEDQVFAAAVDRAVVPWMRGGTSRSGRISVDCIPLVKTRLRPVVAGVADPVRLRLRYALHETEMPQPESLPWFLHPVAGNGG